jgi:hypothetical protein
MSASQYVYGEFVVYNTFFLAHSFFLLSYLWERSFAAVQIIEINKTDLPHASCERLR